MKNRLYILRALFEDASRSWYCVDCAALEGTTDQTQRVGAHPIVADLREIGRSIVERRGGAGPHP